MREQDAIDAVNTPSTVDSIVADLQRLGVQPGSTMLVHSSLSSLGWVCGGASAVVDALLGAIGGDGTLVMPTQSTYLSDPSLWESPPVAKEWWPIIRESTPAFDPRTTATRQMGAIVETFRTYRGVVRSNHPLVSFAAVGPRAESLMRDHPLADGFGMKSPLGKMYEASAHVLLLGVGHASSTSLHLAERIAYADDHTTQVNGAPMRVKGARRWVEFDEPLPVDIDFVVIGDAIRDSTDHVNVDSVAAATAQLMPQRELVDFAVKWMKARR